MEFALRNLAANTGLEAVILGLPFVYGPCAHASFGRLLLAVKRDVPLRFGRVENRRSLTYRENLATAIGVCVLHPSAGSKTYMVSDGDGFSTHDLLGASLQFSLAGPVLQTIS